MTGCGGSSSSLGTAVSGADGSGSRERSTGRRIASLPLSNLFALVLPGLLLAVATLPAGCAGARRGETPPGPPISRQPLPGSDRLFPSQDPRNQAPPGAPEAFPDPVSSAGPAWYQVQLFASGSAQAAREKAMEIAERMQMPVRVIQDGGLHMVRAGVALDPVEAGRLQKLAIDLGYRDAMIVPPSQDR